jgi:hypothetical protein
MKTQVPHLLLAVDLGASGTKTVASIVGRPDCQAVLMTPSNSHYENSTGVER